ncbi:hypothetical protein QS306_11680 [Paraburkholderia bonniea]|uniref:hypothetical protein n=1 Tax=Paraburkholderia bonniea TaxID=2152891 RepID=UPI001290A291|nr:hypothetical protein [Paraburkholderia bonniea]WJF89755.1 hypothetical protein QS306_11680 [Paraburkholderia bonniea]WJF93069.1 hypothetical protein QS308_11690 [Paraburkholderia bonniea]
MSESERIAAKEWLEKLKTTGFVETSDNEPARKAAVGGVQWAMEASLQGIQYIITPDRPTPFRTHGEAQRAHGQAEREEGLIQRMLQGNSLHLVFCKEGVGTPNQDAIYRREVLEQFAGSERLQEHYLVHSKEMFPVEHSGAFILAPHNGATVAFAIHAAQVDKVTNTKVIRLYFGVLESGSTHPLDVALNDWKKFLQDENIPFAGGN